MGDWEDHVIHWICCSILITVICWCLRTSWVGFNVEQYEVRDMQSNMKLKTRRPNHNLLVYFHIIVSFNLVAYNRFNWLMLCDASIMLVGYIILHNIFFPDVENMVEEQNFSIWIIRLDFIRWWETNLRVSKILDPLVLPSPSCRS